MTLHTFETEEQIETWAERIMDRLDGMFLSGSLSQKDYDDAVYALDTEAMQMLKAIKPAPFRESFRSYK